MSGEVEQLLIHLKNVSYVNVGKKKLYTKFKPEKHNHRKGTDCNSWEKRGENSTEESDNKGLSTTRQNENFRQ